MNEQRNERENLGVKDEEGAHFALLGFHKFLARSYSFFHKSIFQTIKLQIDFHFHAGITHLLSLL